jgi:hypothetical protein
VRMPAGHLPSPPIEAARLFPEPAAGEPYTILIMPQSMQIQKTSNGLIFCCKSAFLLSILKSFLYPL